jgi:hypothetical protein
MRLRLLSLALAAFALQQPSPPADAGNLSLPTDFVPGSAGVVSFSFDWPEAEVPHWFIEVGDEPGDTLHGRYDKLEAGAKPSAETRRPITVSQATMNRIRGGYRTVASGVCETRTRHIAQTGAKHIAYTMAGSDAWSSCTFNYSDDKTLMDAVAAFQAMAETMQMGERLEHTHRFDRLGLDAQLDFLTSEAKEGHAIELQNIAPVLQSIVDDDRVIERARRKAARLLQDAVPPAASVPATTPR